MTTKTHFKIYFAPVFKNNPVTQHNRHSGEIYNEYVVCLRYHMLPAVTHTAQSCWIIDLHPEQTVLQLNLIWKGTHDQI